MYKIWGRSDLLALSAPRLRRDHHHLITGPLLSLLSPLLSLYAPWDVRTRPPNEQSGTTELFLTPEGLELFL